MVMKINMLLLQELDEFDLPIMKYTTQQYIHRGMILIEIRSMITLARKKTVVP